MVGLLCIPFQKNNRFVPLEKNLSAKDDLWEIVIPNKEKAEILRGLDRLGINSMTLYPDLSGLCAYLNWKHQVDPSWPL